MRKLSGWAVLAAIIALAGCTSQLSSAQLAQSSPALASIISSGPLAGVYEPDAPFAWGQQAAFGSATGAKVRIAVYYSGWLERFRVSFAQMARRHGSYVLVQIEPADVSLASIAAGSYDSYLRSYALSVHAFGYPVILSFGHEMNGNWYSWGSGHVSPSVFVAAWRHVVQVFRDERASNAVWAWAINSTNLAHSSLRQWWPGASWVNLIGIDGYYYRSSDTFSSVFGQTIVEIRKFSNAPILISETAVGTVADRTGKIRALIANVRADHLVGMVWFDKGQDGDVFRQDWRLEDDRAALAAFRASVRKYLRLPIVYLDTALVCVLFAMLAASSAYQVRTHILFVRIRGIVLRVRMIADPEKHLPRLPPPHTEHPGQPLWRVPSLFRVSVVITTETRNKLPALARKPGIPGDRPG